MEKNLTTILQVLFIIAIFGASYAAFGNNSSPQQSQPTTVVAPAVVYASGITNATIVKFEPSFTIRSTCNASSIVNSTFSQITSLLSLMEANNSVSTYYRYQSSNLIRALANTANTSQIYDSIAKSLNETARSCLLFNSSVTVMLPARMNFTINSQRVVLSIPQNARNNTISIPITQNMSRNLSVSVAAVVTSNGTIYGNLQVAKR